MPVFTAWAGFVLCLWAEMTITTDIHIIIYIDNKQRPPTDPLRQGIGIAQTDTGTRPPTNIPIYIYTYIHKKIYT